MRNFEEGTAMALMAVLARIKADLRVLKWMVGFNLAATMAILVTLVLQ